MSSRRVLKAAEAIREVVSMAILTDIKDPRVENVTVTFVEVSADLRHAKVHVSVMADENKKQTCLRGLQSAAGYLQKKVGNRIDTRYVPHLKFELDRGLENAMIVTRILEEVLPAEKADENSDEENNDESSQSNDTDQQSADYDSPSESSLAAKTQESDNALRPATDSALPNESDNALPNESDNFLANENDSAQDDHDIPGEKSTAP